MFPINVAFVVLPFLSACRAAHLFFALHSECKFAEDYPTCEPLDVRAECTNGAFMSVDEEDGGGSSGAAGRTRSLVVSVILRSAAVTGLLVASAHGLIV